MANRGIQFRNVVWISFGLSFVLINLIAEVGEYYTGVHIHMLLRISFIAGVTVGVSVLGGTMILVQQLDEEKPRSGYVRDTLSADRKREDGDENDYTVPHK